MVSKTLDVKDEKNRSTFRRILLAKQLYLHALEHSAQVDSLSKMIAVHNFHNAVEIALRAIFLHYEIRPEKQLNIEFEAMLNEIDKYKGFKDKDIKLPYRQEMRNLNQLRNLVQHHAVEPETTTMEDWRVFTRRFLIKVCENYFDLNFDSLSSLEMISDETLRRLLELSLASIEKRDFKQSLKYSTIVFKWSTRTILEFLPDEKIPSQHVDGWGFIDFKEINEALEKATFYAALLSSGINLIDYKRFITSIPGIDFSLSGKVLTQWFGPEPDEETTRWVHDFVVTTVVRWQVLGLAPGIPEWFEKTARELIEDGAEKL